MYHIVYRRGEGLSLEAGARPVFWNNSSAVLYSSKSKNECSMVLDEYQDDLSPGEISMDEMRRKYQEMAAQAKAEVVREKNFAFYSFRLSSGWAETFTVSATHVERGVTLHGVLIGHQEAVR